MLLQKLKNAYNSGWENSRLTENLFWFHPHTVQSHAKYANQAEQWEKKSKELDSAYNNLNLLERAFYKLGDEMFSLSIPLKALPLKEPLEQ